MEKKVEKPTEEVEKPTEEAEKPTEKVEKPTTEKAEKPTAKAEKPTAKAAEKPATGPSYPEAYLKIWQHLWGERFLSPGGAEEVLRLTEGRGLGGSSVLDLGCGLGGPAAVLVQDANVYSLVGIDSQARLVEQANEWAAGICIDDTAEFRHVDSFPWPFQDNTFDAVFSKDLLFQKDDVLYDEIFRVLKPGGRLIMADWFGTEEVRLPEFCRWLEKSACAKVAMTRDCVVDFVTLSGFKDIDVEDRSERFIPVLRGDLEKLQGEAGKSLADAVGAEALREFVTSWAEPCAKLLVRGQLRLGTIYARKPSE